MTSFTTTVLASGGTTTGFEIPAEIVEQLGGGKRPKVVATINGSYSYRSSIAVMGGRYMLGLSGARRDETGLGAGDEVSLNLELDTAPREVEVPEDLAAAFAADADARKAFESLAYSHQLRHVLSIAEAKTEETRVKRVAKTIAMLKEGKK